MSALIESEAEEGLGTDEELEDAESIAGSAISEVAGDEDINNSEDEEGLDEDLGKKGAIIGMLFLIDSRNKMKENRSRHVTMSCH